MSGLGSIYLRMKQAVVGANSGTGIVTAQAPNGIKPMPLSQGYGAAAVGGNTAAPAPAGGAGAGAAPPAGSPPAPAPAPAPEPPKDNGAAAQIPQLKKELGTKDKQVSTAVAATGRVMQNTLDRSTQRIDSLLKNVKKTTADLAALKMAAQPAQAVSSGTPNPEVAAAPGAGRPVVIGGKPVTIGAPTSAAPATTPPVDGQQPQGQEQAQQQQQPATPDAVAAAAPQPQHPISNVQPLSSDPASRMWQLRQFAQDYVQNGDWHGAADAAARMWGPAAAQDVGSIVYEMSSGQQQQQMVQQQQQQSWQNPTGWQRLNPFYGIQHWRQAYNSMWDQGTGQYAHDMRNATAPRPTYFGTAGSGAATPEQVQKRDVAVRNELAYRNAINDQWRQLNGMNGSNRDFARSFAGNLIDNQEHPWVDWATKKVMNPKSRWYSKILPSLVLAGDDTRRRGAMDFAGILGSAADNSWKGVGTDAGRFFLNTALPLGDTLAQLGDQYLGSNLTGTVNDPGNYMTEAQRQMMPELLAAPADSSAPDTADPGIWEQLMQSGLDPNYLAGILPLLLGSDGQGDNFNHMAPSEYS